MPFLVLHLNAYSKSNINPFNGTGFPFCHILILFLGHRKHLDTYHDERASRLLRNISGFDIKLRFLFVANLMVQVNTKKSIHFLTIFVISRATVVAESRPPTPTPATTPRTAEIAEPGTFGAPCNSITSMAIINIFTIT